MAKKEEEEKEIVGMPINVEMPTIKKVVDCPNCGGKILVEFEVELAPLIPMLTKGLEQAEKEKEGADGKD